MELQFYFYFFKGNYIVAAYSYLCDPMNVPYVPGLFFGDADFWIIDEASQGISAGIEFAPGQYTVVRFEIDNYTGSYISLNE